MQRVIVAPAPVPLAALEELKSWLAITTSGDDAALTGALEAALAMCEAFTGQLPLVTTLEERLRPSGAWQALATRPVQAIGPVESLALDGARSAMASEAYAIDIDADAVGRVRFAASGGRDLALVTFDAGLASDWASLPDGLRHGLVRLAAALYRAREDEAPQAPPAAVAALWRPYRRLRVA